MKLNEFLAISYTQPRLSREKMERYIEDIITEGREPTVDDLAVIYRYFMPARPSKLRKNFTPFEWVAAAAARDDERYYLNWVYADGSHIMASNGHRAHIMKDDREPGYYCPVKGVKVHDKDWASYPDVFRRIVPDVSEGYNRQPGLDTTFHSVSTLYNTNVLTITGTESHVQERYWAEATAWGEGTVVYTPNDKDRVVRLDIPAHNAMAVIMPVRV